MAEPRKKPVVSNPQEVGLVEGVASLHSWIKSQTMIRPAGKEPKTTTIGLNLAAIGAYDDDVSRHYKQYILTLLYVRNKRPSPLDFNVSLLIFASRITKRTRLSYV